jgi:hypothetical protein
LYYDKFNSKLFKLAMAWDSDPLLIHKLENILAKEW